MVGQKLSSGNCRRNEHGRATRQKIKTAWHTAFEQLKVPLCPGSAALPKSSGRRLDNITSQGRVVGGGLAERLPLHISPAPGDDQRIQLSVRGTLRYVVGRMGRRGFEFHGEASTPFGFTICSTVATAMGGLHVCVKPVWRFIISFARESVTSSSWSSRYRALNAPHKANASPFRPGSWLN